MLLDRSSGILLHITSLPGKYGIGTIGKEAFSFADQLNKCEQKYWQILPIGPVSPVHGFSPYSSSSTFAGNSLLISLEKISMEDWYTEEIDPFPEDEDSFIPFDIVMDHKTRVLDRACSLFFKNAGQDEISGFNEFSTNSSSWLDDYSLFKVLADDFKTYDWQKWDKQIRQRDPDALKYCSEKFHDKIQLEKFKQFIFFRQWAELKLYCNEKGIRIIGDIPIYVTMDSADAWANPGIFQLNIMSGKPVSVSGVPPDYFSNTGQRWGNPLYKWEDDTGKLNPELLKWWAQRISHLGGLVDILRIDHFRAFEAYWSIPSAEKTAVNGTWIDGPGELFFRELEKITGKLNLIAEDLGVITPEIEKLRDDLGFPGMKILQFAFDFNNKNTYLPHSYDKTNFILYTGTHDNNTTNGWFWEGETDDNKKKYIMEYLGNENYDDFHWQLIKAAYRTVADLVMIPAQDILGYGEKYRMNTPGTTSGNWRWKLREGDITGSHMERLSGMCRMFDRLPDRNN